MTDLPEEVMERAVSILGGTLLGHVNAPEKAVYRAAREAISALSAEGYMVVKGWRPIEEYDRTAGFFLVRLKRRSGLEIFVAANSTGWQWWVKGIGPVNPTHYAPLLPAPETE